MLGIHVSRSPRVSKKSYYSAADLGLDGKEQVDLRLRGLEPLLGVAQGQSVLDLGCAEGLILARFLDAGAVAGQGLEVNPRRARAARRIVRSRSARFDLADLSDPRCGWLRCLARPTFDVVLMLGVYQHLAPEHRAACLRAALRVARQWFAFRGPPAEVAEAHEIVLREGLTQTGGLPRLDHLGELRLYARVAPAFVAVAA